jgi:hypothetical protein
MKLPSNLYFPYSTNTAIFMTPWFSNINPFKSSVDLSPKLRI